MSKYYVEYGALQANAERLIECDTSALPAKKITEEFATEIADALNRQSQTIGNAAALRDALEVCVKRMSDAICDNTYGDDVVYLVGCMKTCIDCMRAALSAPPRQCDVGTPEEQYARHEAYCDKQDMYCLSDDIFNCRTCFTKWAQTPYAEEGDKHDKHNR